MRINTLKRAAIEIGNICRSRNLCQYPDDCPFWNEARNTCMFDHNYPMYWTVEEATDKNPQEE